MTVDAEEGLVAFGQMKSGGAPARGVGTGGVGARGGGIGLFLGSGAQDLRRV